MGRLLLREPVTRNDETQRSYYPRLGIHRARDRGDVGLDAAFDDDVSLVGDAAAQRVPRRRNVEGDGSTDPAGVPDRVGALDDADVQRRPAVPLDAEVRGLTGFRDQLLHHRLGEGDQRLVGQRLRAELDQTASGLVCAEFFLADEPGGFERAQEAKRRARREIAIPGTVSEIRAAPVADGREQGERAFDRPGERLGHVTSFRRGGIYEVDVANRLAVDCH